MFISFLYMFRATMCPLSWETAVSMRHLVLVTLYGWLSGMHTRQSPETCSEKNKHTKKIVHQVGFIYKILWLGVWYQRFRRVTETTGCLKIVHQIGFIYKILWLGVWYQRFRRVTETTGCLKIVHQVGFIYKILWLGVWYQRFRWVTETTGCLN
jgi:hypothetical protein